jgi:DNA-binding HxlR family transcriptional regulator
MLIQQLRDLEEDGIVSRTLYPQVPPKVEYCLTEVGKGLRPVFIALLNWAELQRSTISIEEPVKACPQIAEIGNHQEGWESTATQKP